MTHSLYAEIVRREEERARRATARKNAEYLQAGAKQRALESAAVARLLAEQRRLHALKHPPRTAHGKKPVKVGERKLGPGFLERYGEASAQ